MNKLIELYARTTALFESVGGWLPQLGIRALLAWEYWESGVMKYNGSNWFSNIQDSFPFPFSVIPTDISWFLATWFELFGAIAILVGLGTRFFSASLVILTIVAWAAVHAGNGFNVCSNGYKLPLMYLVLFAPLLFNGAGKASIDHFLARRFMR